MNKERSVQLRQIFIFICLFCLGLGLLLRLYNITAEEFYLYDEGLYLNYNHLLLKIWNAHPPQNWEDWKQVILVWFRFSLASGKALWFLLVDARIFFGGIDWLFFPRVISLIAGCVTLGVTFLFANKFFKSKWVALLSAVFLAILPSHVFYSKLAFQEALSTLFFLAGFYLYLSSKDLNKRTFLSALCCACAYFTNYRLVILPALVLFTEIFTSLSQHRGINYRKYIWHSLGFGALVILIGNIDLAQNASVTYSWMFHQANLAETRFDWFNLFSYPYFLFRLESVLFAGLFFANIYYLVRKEYAKLFPFALVCVLMLIFSLTAEKAARYLCVVTPFMAMAAASVIFDFFQNSRDQLIRISTVFVGILTLFSLLTKSIDLVSSHSGYKPSLEPLAEHNVKVLSTQPWVHKLYVPNPTNVQECPHSFSRFIQFYMNGFRYLILCPQTYISWTKDQKRFTFELEDYLSYVDTSVKPVRTIPHLSPALLERFVLEHNENLWQSIVFLNSNRKGLREIRVYDMRSILESISNKKDVKDMKNLFSDD